MFKYLWLIVILMLYLWWVVKAIQGLITGIKFAKNHNKRFKFDYLPDVTAWYIFIHAIAIFAWSTAEFVFYYSS